MKNADIRREFRHVLNIGLFIDFFDTLRLFLGFYLRSKLKLSIQITLKHTYWARLDSYLLKKMLQPFADSLFSTQLFHVKQPV